VVYALFATLLVGLLFLLVAPTFTEGVSERSSDQPLLSLGAGLLVAVGLPALVAVLVLLVLVLPIALVGFVLFGRPWLTYLALLLVALPAWTFGSLVYGGVLWLGYVLGGLALGTWLLSLVEVTNRWGALALGVLVLAALSFVPVLGGFVVFVVVLLGVGALALGVWARVRRLPPPAELDATG